MKTKTLALGAMLVCLLSCLGACTRTLPVKPLPVHAAEPVVVTRTQYVELEGNLLNPVEAAWGFANVWSNGSMYSALTHDSQWLETCRAQIDGIRAAYAAQSARAAGSTGKTPPETAPASAAKPPGL